LITTDHFLFFDGIAPAKNATTSMKTNIKLLFLLLTPTLGLMLAPSPAFATVTSSIYISVRTDGLPGSGTLASPFNGSTEAKFDTLMKNFPANTQINLLAGTYMTNGFDAFSIKAGWVIQGAGMGVTTLKLSPHATTHGLNFLESFSEADGMEIHDLTCDANYGAWMGPAHAQVGGILVWGNNVLVQNVEMTGCYGDSVNGLEQFSILVGGNQGPTHEIANNCTIKGCVTHNYASGSNYTNGPLISYCTNSQIIGCTDDGANHGFGFAAATNSQITNCTSTKKTAVAVYTDTSFITGMTIQGSTLAAASIPIQFNSAAAANNVKIINNALISYTPTISGNAAIVLSGSGSGTSITVTGNTYIYLGSLTYSGLILNNGQNFKGLDVENNSSNGGLVGWGGGGTDVTNASNFVANNKFNLPLASVWNSTTSTPVAAPSSTSTSTTTSTTTVVSSTPASVPASSTSTTSTTTTTASVAAKATPTQIQQGAATTVGVADSNGAKFAAFQVLVPPSSGISLQDFGVRAHSNLRVLDVPDSDGAKAAQFNTPATLRALYHLPATGGSGAIAIVDAYDFPTALNDFNAFSNYFVLPQETSTTSTLAANKTFQVVYASGTRPQSGGSYISSWNLEAALDIEWAHAMAPNAKIYLVEAASDSTADLDAAVRVASQLTGVKEVSMSWGGNEVPWEGSSLDSTFTTSGVVYLASSGDSTSTMEYPAASPNVISCGGTTVTRTSAGVFSSETGWSQAGCGSSLYEQRPAFQASVAAMVGARRGVSDMSFDADPNTGVFVFDSTPLWGETGWWILGGTSLSSPALAGVINLAASSGNGFATSTAQEQARIYASLGNASAFRDIVSGTDGRYKCQTGWDFVTGVGTPNGLVGK
jgi:kumamolisin